VELVYVWNPDACAHLAVCRVKTSKEHRLNAAREKGGSYSSYQTDASITGIDVCVGKSFAQQKNFGKYPIKV